MWSSTQEDPIGLAGGLNLYGYGNGDPLNNSDPFGLYSDRPAQSMPAITVTASYNPNLITSNSGILNVVAQLLSRENPCGAYSQGGWGPGLPRGICHIVNGPRVSSENHGTARCLATEWRNAFYERESVDIGEMWSYLVNDHVDCYSKNGYSLFPSFTRPRPNFALDLIFLRGVEGPRIGAVRPSASSQQTGLCIAVGGCHHRR